MPPLGFRRDVLVSASVNLVPFAILVLFLGLFLVYDPWTPDPFALGIALGLLLVPIVALLVATGAAARLIGAEEAA